jgi:hypothetical protein
LTSMMVGGFFAVVMRMREKLVRTESGIRSSF